MGKHSGKGKAPAYGATYGGGFLPLGIQAESSAHPHYLYVRAASERAVFAANLPVDFDEGCARAVFSRFGVIEDVVFGKGAGRSALERAVLELSDDEASEEEEEPEEPAPQADDDGWTFVGTAQPKRRRRRRLREIPQSVPQVAPLISDPVQSLHASGRATCTVTFLDAVAAGRVMKHTGTIAYKAPTTGLARYIAQYASLRPKLAAVKAHADSAMARHDHLHGLLLTSKARAQGAGAVVDADGFTVVVRSGRYGRTAGRGADGAGVAVASFADEEKARGKKKGRGAGELTDFYKFQALDRKKRELASMRRKFEEDRQRVADLKSSRRYKPY